MIKLVIFDFDGTLVDTAEDIVSATNEFREAYGHPPLSKPQIKAGIGMGLKELLLNVYQQGQEEVPDSKIQEFEDHFLEIYERHHLLQAHAFAGLHDFLNAWTGQVAILSNKSERFIHSILKHLQLADRNWVSIVGGDTYAFKKPHPSPFEHVMKDAGVTREETVMVGDGEPDMLGARNAQITAIAAAYGYCSVEKLRELGAHHVIHELRDLLPLLKQLG